MAEHEISDTDPLLQNMNPPSLFNNNNLIHLERLPSMGVAESWKRSDKPSLIGVERTQRTRP